MHIASISALSPAADSAAFESTLSIDFFDALKICLLLSFTVLMLVLLVTYISLSVWMLAFSTEINCTSFVFCERRRRAACTSSSADIRSSSAFFARSSI
jgi:hypothetical protein